MAKELKDVRTCAKCGFTYEWVYVDLDKSEVTIWSGRTNLHKNVGTCRHVLDGKYEIISVCPECREKEVFIYSIINEEKREK